MASPFGSGTYNLGVLFVGEGHIGNGYQPVGPINNAYGRAFINDGTTINVGSFHLGEWDGASGHVIQSGGQVNISNQFRLGHWPQAGGAQNSYTLNGGSISVTGGPADPLNEGGVGNVILGVDSSGTLAINAGTFTAHGITMQTRGATGGESRLQMNGGILNIGINGIVTSNPGALNSYDVQLKGGTIRATQNWSSNLEIALIAGGTGINFDTNGKVVTLSGEHHRRWQPDQGGHGHAEVDWSKRLDGRPERQCRPSADWRRWRNGRRRERPDRDQHARRPDV